MQKYPFIPSSPIVLLLPARYTPGRPAKKNLLGENGPLFGVDLTNQTFFVGL